MKRILSVVCAAALGGVLLAGCGVSAADSTAETLSATDAQTSEPQVTAQAQQNDIQAAQEALQEAVPVQDDAQEALPGDPSINGEYISPLVTMRADPYLYKHEGTYYFTGSYPEYDRIELTSADSVNGIAAAVPKTIWTAPGANSRNPDGSVSVYYKYVWAPEIHYIMDQWVIYFAYSQNGLWDIKACALRCKGDDPMHDEWEYMGMIKPAAGDSFANNSGMTLDMTVFHHDELNKWYGIWAQKPGSSNLYIAEMKTPFEFANTSVMLSQPDYTWEKQRENVNEGPAVLKHAGKIFVSYSAAATGYEYCMGLLTLDACDDPMDVANWTKSATPVFQTDASLKIYGPGHNCFVEGDNGEQLCILHFRDYRDITGDSLLDYNRHAHVMKITYDRDGIPQFHLSADELYNSPFTNHGK